MSICLIHLWKFVQNQSLVLWIALVSFIDVSSILADCVNINDDNDSDYDYW